MAKNYVQKGNVLNYTAGSDISSGDPVLVGNVLGVAITDIATGDTGSVQVEEVFTIAKKTTDVIGQGVLLYWDVGNSELTITAAAGRYKAGIAFEAAGSSDTTVNIKLGGLDVVET